MNYFFISIFISMLTDYICFGFFSVQLIYWLCLSALSIMFPNWIDDRLDLIYGLEIWFMAKWVSMITIYEHAQ
jgi:hypothetical protein